MTPSIVANSIVAALLVRAMPEGTASAKLSIALAYRDLRLRVGEKFGQNGVVAMIIDELESEPYASSRQLLLWKELNAIHADSHVELVSIALSILQVVKTFSNQMQLAQRIVQAGSADTLNLVFVLSVLNGEMQESSAQDLTAKSRERHIDYLDAREPSGTSDRAVSEISELPPPAPSSKLSGSAKAVAQLDDATLVQVFYATDRKQIPDLTGGISYGEQRSSAGNLHYGSCEVSIPKTHRVGKLETPSILRLEFRPNPKKHIILSKTESFSETHFFEKIKSSVDRATGKDAFVFVHGYNLSFENAARRTGQIAYDLDFVGASIFYSWPSNGKTADYLKDETNITWSTPHLEAFLSLLAYKSGAERIHIIAHSMGNRGVCDALKALSFNQMSQLKFNHLVLAAPDLDADTFKELATTLQRLAGRVTLYESSRDKAIQASRKIHGNPRAGEPLLVISGMDTIDASAIDTDFLGHSYFSDNWPLLSDIHSLLFKDEPPSNRFGLVAKEHADGKYYAFKG